MRKIFILAITLSLAMFLTPVMVKADPFLDFNIDVNQPNGAAISFAGGSNPLKGVNIGVDNVTGKNTLLHKNVTVDFHLTNPTDGAILTFTTGNFTPSGPGDWNFVGGGSISIDLPLATGGSLNLLSGSFNSAKVTAGGDTFNVAISAFTDFKNTRLLNFYGLPTGVPYFGNFNISFDANASPGSGFTSIDVLSGDLKNRVPEPATMLLLGSGLLGMGLYARKRFAKK